MPHARVNGVEKYFEVQGEGLPLLFSHGGYGGPFTSLAPPTEMPGSFLGDTARTITYDRRCAGRSEYVLSEYLNENLAADAAALLDHLNVDTAIVIGTSAGGPITMQSALSWPERVSAVGLPNTGAALMSLHPYAGGDGRVQTMGERLALVRERIAPIERPQVEPLTPDEARLFIAAGQTHRLGALFTIATPLGLRQSEAIGLEWDDIDPDGGSCTSGDGPTRLMGVAHGPHQVRQSPLDPFP